METVCYSTTDLYALAPAVAGRTSCPNNKRYIKLMAVTLSKLNRFTKF